MYNVSKSLKFVKFIGESQVRYKIQSKKIFGKWIRNELNYMGPAFIKFGQFLSTRQDIFEKEIIQELQKLQDDITPIPYNDIQLLLDAHYNKPYNDIFSYIDPIPIATASIGQVHLAKITTDKYQQDVVIKIQKPDITMQIKQDFETINYISNSLKIFNNPAFNEFDNLIKQFERFITKELDYKSEINHMINFRKLFKNSDLPVKIPTIIKSLSSSTIIVMEYVPSIKITNVEELKKMDIDTKIVADNLIKIFLYQIINLGYVHCDPHPGNLGIYKDNSTIVLYDFGNCVEFNKKFKKNLNQLIFCIYQKDVNEFVELMIELDILIIQNEYEIIEVKSFFGYFFKYLESLDFSSLTDSIATDDISSGFQANLRINPDFLSLFRIFSLIDGTCSLLDKNFNYITAIEPYSQTLMNDVDFFNYRAQKDFSKIRSYPGMMQSNETNIIKIQKKISNVNKDLNTTQFVALILLLFNNNQEILAILISITLAYKLTDLYNNKKQ